MARQISPAMRPYTELQKSLPPGTPFAERARLAKALKRELATGRRTNPSQRHQHRHRRNPSPGTLLLVGLAVGGAWWWTHRKAVGTPPPPISITLPSGQVISSAATRGGGCG